MEILRSLRLWQYFPFLDLSRRKVGLIWPLFCFNRDRSMVIIGINRRRFQKCRRRWRAYRWTQLWAGIVIRKGPTPSIWADLYYFSMGCYLLTKILSPTKSQLLLAQDFTLWANSEIFRRASSNYRNPPGHFTKIESRYIGNRRRARTFKAKDIINLYTRFSRQTTLKSFGLEDKNNYYLKPPILSNPNTAPFHIPRFCNHYHPSQWPCLPPTHPYFKFVSSLLLQTYFYPSASVVPFSLSRSYSITFPSLSSPLPSELKRYGRGICQPLERSLSDRTRSMHHQSRL